MTAATLTLTEFLLARIAEDESDALALDKELGRWHRERAAGTIGGSQGDILTTLIMPGTAMHPARVLAEVEAKRRMVERPTCTDDCSDADCQVINEDRRILAAVYADHPDYRDDWRP